MTMTSKNLEDWEKQFIKSEDLEAEDLTKLLEGLASYCELSKNGYVRLFEIAEKLTKKEQIHIVLSARMVANKLQTKLKRSEPIDGNVTSDEISRMVKMDKSSVQARISELRKEHKVDDSTKGVYRATLPEVIRLVEGLRKEGK